MIWTPGGRPRGVCCVVLNRRPSRRPDASRPCRPPGQARFILPGDLRRPKRPTPVPRSLICRISVFGPVCGTARPKLATPGSPSGALRPRLGSALRARRDAPSSFCRGPRVPAASPLRTPVRAGPVVFEPPPTVLASETDWQVELFFKWIKQHLRIKQWRSAARRCLTEGAASSRVDAS
jgi:hypothetical protein